MNPRFQSLISQLYNLTSKETEKCDFSKNYFIISMFTLCLSVVVFSDNHLVLLILACVHFYFE